MRSGPGPRTPQPRPAGAVWRAAGVIALALVAGPVVADHSLPPVRQNGAGWVTWLLVAGGILAVGLAAWAFFAPEKPPPSAPQGGPER